MYNSCTRSKRGALAQLGARIAGSDEVTGSSPVCSTIANSSLEIGFFYAKTGVLWHFWAIYGTI